MILHSFNDFAVRLDPRMIVRNPEEKNMGISNPP